MAIQQFPAASGGPSGGETVWTVVSNGTFNNTFSTLTFSGLSGYKVYNLVVNRLSFSAVNRTPAFRINGVTSGDYTFATMGYNNNVFETSFYDNADSYRPLNGNPGSLFYCSLMFNDADLTGQKTITGYAVGRDTGANRFTYPYQLGNNPLSNTSPITSITMFERDAGTNFNGGSYTLYGGN